MSSNHLQADSGQTHKFNYKGKLDWFFRINIMSSKAIAITVQYNNLVSSLTLKIHYYNDDSLYLQWRSHC